MTKCNFCKRRMGRLFENNSWSKLLSFSKPVAFMCVNIKCKKYMKKVKNG